MTTCSADSALLESFHLMYDHFPEPVMLIHRSREILAVNRAGELAGAAPGMICSRQGDPAAHRGCLADKALAAQDAAWMRYPAPNRPGETAIAFWLPVSGHPEIYVHFGVGNVRDYATPPAFV